LNVAQQEKMRFGTDIVFTFGPFAAVDSYLYSPSLHTLVSEIAWLFSIIFGVLISATIN
jgi:hypothetical protein